MKKVFLIVFFQLITVSSFAQPVVPFTAKQFMAQVEAEAVQSFAPDAELVQVFFTEFSYMGTTIRLNLSTGSANGWMYRFYSPTSASEKMYFVYKSFNTVVIEAPPGSVSVPAHPVSAYAALPDSLLDSPPALLAVKSGGAGGFLQANPAATIVRAAVFVNHDPGPVFPVGTLWVFWFASGADTLRCTIDAVSGTSVDCALLTSTRMPPSDAEFQILPLYPHPVSTELHLALRNPKGPVTLSLYNMLGEHVFENIVEAGRTSATLNTSAFSPGTYLLVTRSMAGTQTQRIIVAH